jgi:hypothetical protein
MYNKFRKIACGGALAEIFARSVVDNRKPGRSKRPFLQLLAIVALALCGHVADARTPLPDVPDNFCKISQDDVLPPDNRALLSSAPPHADLACAFLERAEKMFLWVTSPYGGDSYVFRSPAFFDASPADSGRRDLAIADATNSNLKNLHVTIAIEPGEADGKVLVTRDCRLVYYLMQVNDVYAYFLTGVKNGIMQDTEFPTGKTLVNGKTDLDMIVDLAREHDKVELEDGKALAVELKSAWVEVAESEKMNFITMKRTIPTYDNPVPCSSTSTSTSWYPNGSREALLGLVGMHVVFSAEGHPEMLWATFEHIDNTPNQDYRYFEPSGHPQTQKSDIADHWMFSDGNPGATFNEARMHFDKSGNIVADGNTPVGPSNIRRNAPWGALGVEADLNTKIISINSQFIGRLADNDVRKNYIMIGTSWTCATGDCSGGGDPGDVHKRQGSEQLANTTMETFYNKGASTCFECHHGPNMLGDHCKKAGLSHLFGALQPLFGRDSRGECTQAN